MFITEEKNKLSLSLVHYFTLLIHKANDECVILAILILMSKSKLIGEIW